MAVSQTKLNEEIRQRVMVDLFEAFGEREDLQRIASNKFAYPTVDAENCDKWVVLTVTVPTSVDFDGYGEAESYTMKCNEKKAKAEEQKKKKAEKIRKDAERRAKMKEKELE